MCPKVAIRSTLTCSRSGDDSVQYTPHPVIAGHRKRQILQLRSRSEPFCRGDKSNSLVKWRSFPRPAMRLIDGPAAHFAPPEGNLRSSFGDSDRGQLGRTLGGRPAARCRSGSRQKTFVFWQMPPHFNWGLEFSRFPVPKNSCRYSNRRNLR